MQCSSKVSACRRELNSHDAAEPRTTGRPQQRTEQRMYVECQSTEGPVANYQRCAVGEARSSRSWRRLQQQRHGAGVLHRGSQLRRRPWSSVSSSGRRGQPTVSERGRLQRRHELVAHHLRQRGAGNSCGRSRGITGPWQAQPQRSLGAALPNPSLKRSANGRPPGPVWRYAVHFRQPGPGVLPLSPA